MDDGHHQSAVRVVMRTMHTTRSKKGQLGAAVEQVNHDLHHSQTSSVGSSVGFVYLLLRAVLCGLVVAC